MVFYLRNEFRILCPQNVIEYVLSWEVKDVVPFVFEDFILEKVIFEMIFI